jgi:ribosomal protein S20
LRQQTDDSIASTEKTLNGINRKLSDQEEKTAAQIREYLKQARDAITAGDVDGANKLAFKAKVLLDELLP